MQKTLLEFRAEIDALDEEILKLLAKRQKVVEQVRALKADERAAKRSIIRAGREATMVRDIVQKGGEHYSPSALAYIWRLLISAAIKAEENPAIAIYSPSENREAFWLTREHFGAFAECIEKPTNYGVIGEVLAHQASIGVVSMQRGESERPWWLEMVEHRREDLHIFLRLPFLCQNESNRPALFAMAHLDPEDTGDDMSLFVIESTGAWNMHDTVLDQFIEGDKHYYFVEVEGFVNADSDWSSQVMADHNVKALYYAGSYASPMMLD